MSTKVTIFEHINETKRPYYIYIEHALQRIRNGKSLELVKLIRTKKTKEERNEIKKKLPSVCFSGTFEERRKDKVIAHSGFICLDFDDVECLEEKKEQLKTNKYIYACWISPSGNGLKALVKIPANIEKHCQYFDSLKQTFPDIDNAGRDVSRVCYESFDTDIYINNLSEVYDHIVEPDSFEFANRKPIIQLTEERVIIDKLEKWMANNGEVFGKGTRNAYILKLAGAFNRYGISEFTALEYLKRYRDDDFLDAEIERTVKNAYKQKEAHGISYFENVEVKTSIRQELRTGANVFDVARKIASENNIADNDALSLVTTEKNKINNRLETFWTVEVNNKGIVSKILLNRKKFISFLSENGYFRHRINIDYHIYIRIVDNIIEQVNQSDIKNFVFGYIERLENSPFDGIDKDILFEFMAAGVKTFFDNALLDLLPIANVKINKDTKDAAFFYYVNGAVKITKDNIEILNYCDLIGSVWKNQIIDRHIMLNDEKNSNTFFKFLNLIVTSAEGRASLLSIIGYLLHRYKDKRMSKAIIINDKQISDNPEGGSGKGLIVNGIGQIRKIITLDGKSFTPDKSFAFQRIELDTEIICIDDLKKNFNFESLFSIITEGITVEKKNKGEFFIPFEESPKLVITTNYYTKGEGSSNDRRKVDIEINNYFNAKHTPYDEFGHTFFTDYTPEEWNDFDNAMIKTCRFYMENGISTSSTDTIMEKKLLVNTSPEFVEWITENIHFNIGINRQSMLKEFTNSYSNLSKLSIKKFIQWLETYCNHCGYVLNKNYKRSGNNFYITIQKNGTEEISDRYCPFGG